ncbi:NACHT domain-containing protein [Nonomuraea fuscirosea]|uniref:NACHT domain-containing protein n=1 Tax=Nonomuraea fuscirosea TaxID=1291556 RepID=UPI0034465D62
MTRRRAWGWAAGGLTLLALAVYAGINAIPSFTIGEVDPFSATSGVLFGLISSSAGAWAIWMAIRAARWQESNLQDAASRLAQTVLAIESKERRQLLGQHDKAINLTFALQPTPGHPASGASSKGSFRAVTNYYRKLSPRRLVITGAPGAGKTLLAVELILGLVEHRTPTDPVPIRLSAASLNTTIEPNHAVEAWLCHQLTRIYRLKRSVAKALVASRMVLPIIDGLDEMDATERPQHTSRAGLVIRGINAYHGTRSKGGIVLTCRSNQYQALEAISLWTRDAAHVHIAPVSSKEARTYLLSRVENPARWKPVLMALKRNAHAALARGLSTPWRLTLAIAIYEQRSHDPNIYSRHPAELVHMKFRSPNEVRDHLLGLLLPTVVAMKPPPGDIDIHKTHQYLATLARFLKDNATNKRSLGNRSLSGTDLVLHELWPIAGRRRPRLIAALVITIISFIGLTIVLTQSSDDPFPLPLTTVALVTSFIFWDSYSTIWSEPRRASLHQLTSDVGRSKLAAALRSSVTAFVTAFSAFLLFGLLRGQARNIVEDTDITLLLWILFVWYAITGIVVAFAIAIIVSIRRRLLVGIAVGTGTWVGFCLAYWLASLPFSLHGNGLAVSIILMWAAMVAIGCTVGLLLGLIFGIIAALKSTGTHDVTDPRDIVPADLAFGLAYGCVAGLFVGLAIFLVLLYGSEPPVGIAAALVSGLSAWIVTACALGFRNELAGLRYLVMLTCTRRWNASPLPWNLGQFLHWSYDVGLFRIAGIAYQFRHYELQNYMAQHAYVRASHD